MSMDVLPHGSPAASRHVPNAPAGPVSTDRAPLALPATETAATDSATTEDDSTSVTLRAHRRALRLLLLRPGHPRRAVVEAQLRATYERCHAGAPRDLPQWLFGLFDANGEVLATAGLTPATEHPLVARYLPTPPCELLSGLLCEPVEAHELVEIGQLTAVQRGLAPALMVALAAWLAQSHFRWGIATATAPVRRLLADIGIEAQALQPARADRLGDDAAGYGRYYEADPWVVFGRIDDAVAVLRQRGYMDRMEVHVTRGRRAQ